MSGIPGGPSPASRCGAGLERHLRAGVDLAAGPVKAAGLADPQPAAAVAKPALRRVVEPVDLLERAEIHPALAPKGVRDRLMAGNGELDFDLLIGGTACRVHGRIIRNRQRRCE